MKEILQRVKYGWNFTRVLYVTMGLVITIQASVAHQWAGLFLGIYFLSMGVFAFGCAGGACFTPPVKNNKENDIKDIQFEEVK